MSFDPLVPLGTHNGPVQPLMPHLAAERSVPDPEALQQLVATRGLDAAGDMICHALVQLACRQQAILAAHRACQFNRICAEARRMAAIATQVGMADLARVAGDAMACAQRDDPVALGAVLARLGRLCSGALTGTYHAAETGGG
ncbi:MAG: hypothetical protein GC146_16415 [Limimaricola sp.]|uniref:hypothetical protein n=1 Tax=Limimaricola sp. TaxID=2211665 RepID=UPI001DC0348F|nr:hypothetical protein [Limimaricola sp.]MBI1418801.1 hypothetical protein [Limimaricola sp.]